MEIFTIDYETTGLNPYSSGIIEVAIKKMGIETYYNDFIKPVRKYGPYKYVPPHIVDITNITDEMIEEKGIDVNVATEKMISYMLENASMSDEPIYMLAHNGDVFDFLIFKRMILGRYPKLTRQICNLMKRIVFVDTLLVAKMFMKEDRVNQKRLCQIHNIINEAPHRAYGDVLSLEKLFPKLCLHYSYSKGHSYNYYLEHLDELHKEIRYLKFEIDD
jgi:DNA polymerase III alpha subunit (gram-positive type)